MITIDDCYRFTASNKANSLSLVGTKREAKFSCFDHFCLGHRSGNLAKKLKIGSDRPHSTDKPLTDEVNKPVVFKNSTIRGGKGRNGNRAVQDINAPTCCCSGIAVVSGRR